MQPKYPPPLVFASCAIAIWALPSVLEPHFIQRIIAGVIGVSALIVAGFAVWHFHQAKTTLDPRTPAHTTVLVTSGVYRMSRNPMYLALAALLVAESLWLNRLLGFGVVWGFVWFITRFQILPEEQSLARIFGDNYQDYKKQVPRWLW